MTSRNAAVVAVSWLCLLTIWTAGLTLWLLKKDLEKWEPGLFLWWEAQGLRVAGVDGRWMVTHLENLENRSIAKLPEPLWVVESGGVVFSVASLEKLEWRVPVDPYKDVFQQTEKQAPPREGAKISALYFKASRGEFKERR